ncbi:MAG: glycosyltransferase family 4 protein [Coriobacteriia bacterium]
MGKRILLITTEYPPITGGIGTYCAQIAAAAIRNGHEVTVLAPDYGRSCDDASGDGKPTVIRYRGGSYSVRSFPKLLAQVWRHADPRRYDVIHAIDWPAGVVLGFINRFRRVPYRVTVHGTEILLMPDSRQIKLLGRNFFSAPDLILTNSRFTKSLLLDRFPSVDPNRAKVTLLGVEEYWFQPANNPAGVLAKYGIAADRACILTVGRLDERKGHRLVFRALSALPKSVAEKAIYVVVGKGNEEYTAELHRLARECPVPTVFTGAVTNEDLRALYASAQLFCMPGEPHPRRVEGFGLVYLEAAAQGVAAIASRLGAIPEVVVDGETGIVIEPMDHTALGTAVLQFIQDPAFAQRLGENARKWASGFSWHRCAQETYDEQ